MDGIKERGQRGDPGVPAQGADTVLYTDLRSKRRVKRPHAPPNAPICGLACRTAVHGLLIAVDEPFHLSVDPLDGGFRRRPGAS